MSKKNKVFFALIALSLIPSAFAWYSFSFGDYLGMTIWSILSYGLIYIAGRHKLSADKE